MARPKNVQRYGNELAIMMDDGEKILAYPTHEDIWLVKGEAVGPPPEPGEPGPGPGPVPSGKFSWPFNPSTTVTSEYGPRTGGTGTFHEGIDFGKGGVSTGDIIRCCGDGVVDKNQWHQNFGWMVIIFHGTKNGADWRTLHAHMQHQSSLIPGNAIYKGQTIGAVDTTGAAQGAHLHWETHRCAIGGNIVWNTVNNGNFRTAINPREFMSTYGDGGVLTNT